LNNFEKETEIASGLAENAIRDLKATNETTQAFRDHLEKEMIKQAETYRNLSSDFGQLSAENATVRKQVEKVKKDLSKIKSEGYQRPATTLQAKFASTDGKLKTIDPFSTDESDNGLKIRWLDRNQKHSTKWTHHHSAPGNLEEIEKKIECSCDRYGEFEKQN
jgi:hypothetical protein